MRSSSTVTYLCGTHVEDTSNTGTRTTCASYTTKARSQSDIIVSAPDASGFRKPTPYFASETDYSPYQGIMGYYTHYGTTTLQWTTTGCVQAVAWGNRYVMAPPAAPSAATFPTSLSSEALTKALSRLKDQNVNLAVAAAELGRTGSMLRDTLFRLYTSYKATRKGDLKKALSALGHSTAGFTGRWKRGSGRKATASRWLELQYGWLPLMSDLYGVYTEFTDKQEIRVTTSGSAKSSNRSTSVTNNGVLYQNVSTFAHEYGVYVRLDYAVDFAALANYARDLGITNPALVAWELVPFSFVIDWFVSIGSWLDSLDADFGLTFKGGSLTKRYVRSSESRLVFKNKQTSNASTTYRYTEGAVAWDRRKTITRTVYATSPSPGVYFKNPLSWRHAANAAALLVQSMRIK